MKNIVQVIFLMLVGGILSAQNPLQITNCPTSPTNICDFTINDAELWNEIYWHDPLNNVQNLSEGPTELSISIADTCAITAISYLLFLDLDQNGSQETVINSDNLPGFNNVQFDNAQNPNYAGGTSRAFDERNVAGDAKYGFALQTEIVGFSGTVSLVWNTQQAPTTYTIPALPYGTHRIMWMVTDACGHTTTCAYNIIVKDCKPPIVVCLNGLSANIYQNTQLTLWVTDFLQYAEDNSSPTSLLKFGIRASGTGVGFPVDSLGNPITSITFNCSEIGTQLVEIWAVDPAGNADFCETYMIIQDGSGNCPGQTGQVTTCVNFWKDGSPIKAGTYYQGPFLPVAGSASYDSLGCLVQTFQGALNSNFTATPLLDMDPLNGLNTLDLIRISRSILGLQPLGSPYALIAADANKSGSVTTFDIVEFRKLLLGVYTKLPNNTSWRFVDASYQFPNPNNPFQTSFPVVISGTQLSPDLHLSFIAIKTGDVDGTAYPGFGSPNEDRTRTFINLPDQELQAGESADLPLRLQEDGNWLGMQLGLQFDPNQIQIETVFADNLPGWDENAWSQPQPGQLRLVWFDARPHTFLPGANIVTLRVRALKSLRLRDVLGLTTNAQSSCLPSAAVAEDNTFRPLQLVFAGKGSTTIFAPQPNPVHQTQVQIPLQLEQEEKVRVQVTDLTGRIIYQNEQVLDAGVHTLSLPAAIFPASGMFGWQVQAGKTTASGKLVKL